MPIRHIDHILIAMPAGREDEARAFYHGILGLTEKIKPPQLVARGGCWFSVSTKISLPPARRIRHSSSMASPTW